MTTALKLTFSNAYGEPVDVVDVHLKHRVLSNRADKRQHSTRKQLRIAGLDATQGGVYELSVYPLRHRPVGRVVRVSEGKTTAVHVLLAVDPARVTSLEAPAYDELPEDVQRVCEGSDVEGNAGLKGAALYGALDDPRRAGLLNITAKMEITAFPNGRSVLSYATGLTRLRGDRLFARVEPALRDETKNSIASGLFHEVSGSLHTPPPGDQAAGAFKTLDQYGNLQLTFFSNPMTLEFVVDVDIDDAQGIGHVFQVLKNTLTRSETNPYDIHEILLAHQKLDPGYRLIV
jgi:hypothetical protein